MPRISADNVNISSVQDHIQVECQTSGEVMHSITLSAVLGLALPESPGFGPA